MSRVLIAEEFAFEGTHFLASYISCDPKAMEDTEALKEGFFDAVSKTKLRRFKEYYPEEAEKLRERIASEFCCAELWVTEFSPLMGYACGTGTLGVAFYREG